MKFTWSGSKKCLHEPKYPHEKKNKPPLPRESLFLYLLNIDQMASLMGNSGFLGSWDGKDILEPVSGDHAGLGVRLQGSFAASGVGVAGRCGIVALLRTAVPSTEHPTPHDCWVSTAATTAAWRQRLVATSTPHPTSTPEACVS